MKTLSFESVSTKQSRIAAQARTCPDMVFTTLLTTLHHHIDIDCSRPWAGPFANGLGSSSTSGAAHTA